MWNDSGMENHRFNKKTSRDPEEWSSGSSDPKRMRTACLRVSSVNFCIAETFDKKRR